MWPIEISRDLSRSQFTLDRSFLCRLADAAPAVDNYASQAVGPIKASADVREVAVELWEKAKRLRAEL